MQVRMLTCHIMDFAILGTLPELLNLLKLFWDVPAEILALLFQCQALTVV